MKFIKTEAGQLAFKERSSLFSVRQRSTFILFDGNKTLTQVLAATAGMGVTQADVDQMVAHGFLAPLAGHVAPVVVADSQWISTQGLVAVRTDRSEQDRYKDAKPLATQLTAGLGLRGFRLNLSVESAGGYAELLALLPKIQEAVGSKNCQELERALKG